MDLPHGSGATFDALADEAAKMTEIQRRAAHVAVRLLAAKCDGAGKIDGHGFNKLDAAIGRRLADTPMLTPKQAALARRIARRYARTQLSTALAAELG